MRRRMLFTFLLILGLSVLGGCKTEEKEHKGELVYLEMADRPALFAAPPRSSSSILLFFTYEKEFDIIFSYELVQNRGESSVF